MANGSSFHWLRISCFPTGVEGTTGEYSTLYKKSAGRDSEPLEVICVRPCVLSDKFVKTLVLVGTSQLLNFLSNDV